MPSALPQCEPRDASSTSRGHTRSLSSGDAARLEGTPLGTQTGLLVPGVRGEAKAKSRKAHQREKNSLRRGLAEHVTKWGHLSWVLKDE